MNNENQNVTNNTIGANGINPTPIPNMGVPVGPTPVPTTEAPAVNPVPVDINNGTIPPVQPIETIPNVAPQEPVMTPNIEVSPTPVLTPTEPVINNNIGEQPNNVNINQVAPELSQMQVPTQNLNAVNLQPEGTVIHEESIQEPVTPGPLMGTPLTSQTVMSTTQMPENNNLGLNGMPNPTPMPNLGGMPPQTPDMGMMGGVPMPPQPPVNQEQPKKKQNKTVLLILIIVLILAVGGGVWFFLNASKEKAPTASITPKITQLELGKTINLEDPTEFVTITGISASNCEVKTDVNPNRAGSYTYSVTCGNIKSENNKLVVSDTQPPLVTLKEVVKAIGASVTPEDFIQYIDDASECTVSFKDDEIDTSAEGEQEVEIIVTDAYGNETEEIGTLIISQDAPQYYLYCDSTHESDNYPKTTIQKNYKYGINSMGNRYNTIQEISYIFENEDDYKEAKENINEDIFDGLEGTINTDDENLTIRIETNLTDEELEEIFEISPFPDTEVGINDVHTAIGESCYIDN